MKKILFFYVLFFSISIFADNYVDSITLTKIKKLVQKEEEIALAYKKYILEKGVNPTTLNDLKTANYLPKGFDIINPFAKQITIILDNNSTITDKKDDIHKIRGFESTDPKLKSNLYDYYYSNKYRIYTKAPLSINNSNVEIILSTKEKFIYENSSKITITAPDNSSKTPKDSYYLDENGVLHWYDASGDYKYSFDKELVLDESVTLFDDNGIVTEEYKDLVRNIEFAGMTILYEKNEVAEEHVNIGSGSVIKVNQQTRDIGKTVIQFTRRAGGMIVNGDIYTWGNNANKITGIDLGYSGSTDSYRYPVVTGLVRAKAKMYDDDSTDEKDFTKYYDQNYFSSPNRPKFVDFFSAVFYGTCGVSTKGELYCGGTTGLNYSFGNNFTHVDTNRKGEMLYRSTFFDGKTNKAKKVFANNQIWHILGDDNFIYSWGYDGSAFSGNGNLSFNSEICETICTRYDRWGRCTSSYQECSNEPRNVSNIKFSDITYLLTIGHRKIGGLSTTGDIYIWGREYYKDNSSTSFETYDCSNNWQSTNFNLCTPIKVETSNSTMTTTLKFESIQGGLDAFVAKSEDGKYFKISHPKTTKIQVTSIDDAIKSYSEYVAENDAEILSVDFSRKVNEQGLSKRYIPSSGIVWVNSKNELKGDYLSSSLATEDITIFRNAIRQIKWKKIKVIDDDNGMCGIDINNQMYCWGIQSFYRNGNSYSDFMGNTFMIPVFNTNLYDLEKDFLIAEGGYNGYLTNMTSDEWATTNSDGKTGAFFMKYPTYIGGFNYEFIFK
ncbi:hypothetical protein [Arcobacter aquimarinus]|uniref:hypothetical protein n=1 Tax=Arcobacter aquimarinus TaxID=1315211 RepID=UPI003BB078BC